MLITKGSKCASIPISKAYVEFMGKEKYEGIHYIVFITKSNTWIKGATSHKPRPRECLCVVYVEFTPFMASSFLVGGMATSLFIIIFSTRGDTNLFLLFLFSPFFSFFRDSHAPF